MKFQAGYTKQGLPAFWEKHQNGAFLNIAELICDENFRPKSVINLNLKGYMPPAFHAVFIPKPGDIILNVMENSQQVINFKLYVVTDITPLENKKFVIAADLVGEASDPTELIDAFATNENKQDFENFLTAGRRKLESNEIISFYCSNAEELKDREPLTV